MTLRPKSPAICGRGWKATKVSLLWPETKRKALAGRGLRFGPSKRAREAPFVTCCARNELPDGQAKMSGKNASLKLASKLGELPVLPSRSVFAKENSKFT